MLNGGVGTQDNRREAAENSSVLVPLLWVQ